MAVKILAVDDSATMRTILQMTFAGEDAEVVSVGSADDAMARLGEVAPDVMLVDGALASVDGYELTKRAKGASGDLAVVLLSSQHHPFDEARGSDAGVDAHLDKPFDTQRLIDLVGSTLKGARKAPVGAAASPPAAPPAPAGGEIPGVRPAPRSLKRTMAFGAPVGIKPPSVAPGAPAQPPA